MFNLWNQTKWTPTKDELMYKLKFKQTDLNSYDLFHKGIDIRYKKNVNEFYAGIRYDHLAQIFPTSLEDFQKFLAFFEKPKNT